MKAHIKRFIGSGTVTAISGSKGRYCPQFIPGRDRKIAESILLFEFPLQTHCLLTVACYEKISLFCQDAKTMVVSVHALFQTRVLLLSR